MLDSATKTRIDSARGILVGKVPDPKSQVEQITIALIYKFMDDMDRQSEELGGKATFFAGEFKKYRWAQLLDKRYSGHERLLLYAEGIEKMNVNKDIPQLFRDIFKGVFLPYRDPETLNLFLKEIDGFTYEHSERLGDAFEYLLSVLGTQGDAGQFRTPRHIIDFIVAVVAPKKNETVLDPACGTAGFLISAFKHILSAHGHGAGGTAPSSGASGGPGSTPAESAALTPDERARLMTNFRGYDIAPDMCRLARANLYLHGFPNPVLHEYDTLTSEERWDERCDVILANPPFMTPKGGIRPHNRFSIRAKRSEVLFVDYIAEHLNPGGRAGVIVPEGIIFQSQNAYKQLRKMLVENYLWAVVSLPAGVFNPYSGVKTSILFLDRNLARQRDDVLFVKVENDGFDLGAQRRPVEGSDLPAALRILLEGRVPRRPQSSPALRTVPHGGPGSTPAATGAGVTAPSTPQTSVGGPPSTAAFSAGVEPGPPTLRVPRARLLESPDINLSGDRYRVAAVRPTGKWPMVKLGEVIRTITPPRKIQKSDFGKTGAYPIVDQSQDEIAGWTDDKTAAVSANKPLVIFGDHTCAVKYMDRPFVQGADGIKIIETSAVLLPKFLFFCLQTFPIQAEGYNRHFSKLVRYELPLPPLDEQERIVAELEGYRKVIEGARQILAAYKPTIRIDPKWPAVKLGDVCVAILTGPFGSSLHQSDYVSDGIPVINPKNIIDGKITADGVKMISPDTRDRLSDFAVREKDIVIGRRGEMGRCAIGVTLKNLNQEILSELPIPLPPLAIQRQIVAELEAERKLVEASRELIARMEAKIKAKLAEVWGE